MKNKARVFYIHGGMTFKNNKDYLNYLKNREISIINKKKWHEEFLKKKLKKKFDIIKLRMPKGDDAKYNEWKIHFERYLPFLRNKDILIGNSLGGIFLAKYLSENKLPKKALSLYLIAPPFDNSLEGEDIVGGFNLKKDLSLIEENCKNLYLMFSKDDDVVPLSHAFKYKKKLSNAKIIIYKNKNGHFRISKFPEIVKMIKKDIKK